MLAGGSLGFLSSFRAQDTAEEVVPHDPPVRTSSLHSNIPSPATHAFHDSHGVLTSLWGRVGDEGLSKSQK